MKSFKFSFTKLKMHNILLLVFMVINIKASEIEDSISSLPHEIATYLLTFIPPSDTLKFRVTSRQSLQVSRDEIVWQSYYLQGYSGKPEEIGDQVLGRTYYQMYVSHRFYTKAFKDTDFNSAYDLLTNAAYGGHGGATIVISELLNNTKLDKPHPEYWKKSLIPEPRIKNFFDEQFGPDPECVDPRVTQAYIQSNFMGSIHYWQHEDYCKNKFDFAQRIANLLENVDFDQFPEAELINIIARTVLIDYSITENESEKELETLDLRFKDIMEILLRKYDSDSLNDFQLMVLANYISSCHNDDQPNIDPDRQIEILKQLETKRFTSVFGSLANYYYEKNPKSPEFIKYALTAGHRGGRNCQARLVDLFLWDGLNRSIKGLYWAHRYAMLNDMTVYAMLTAFYNSGISFSADAYLINRNLLRAESLLTWAVTYGNQNAVYELFKLIKNHNGVRIFLLSHLNNNLYFYDIANMYENGLDGYQPIDLDLAAEYYYQAWTSKPCRQRSYDRNLSENLSLDLRRLIEKGNQKAQEYQDLLTGVDVVVPIT